MRTQPFPLLDRSFLIVVSLLLGLGLLMVTSSSIAVADTRLHQPFYFFYRQLLATVLGLLVAGVMIQIPLEFWFRSSRLIFLMGILLLTMVLLPGLGHSVNGARRWLRLGFLGIQPSECMKVGMIIYISAFLVRYQFEVGHRLSGFLYPMSVLAFVALLLLLEPDFGSVAVITVTVVGLLFLGGMKFRQFFFLGGVAALALAVLAFSSPYRLSRLTAFLNPWADQYATGYQLTQSLIAFGRGSFWGVGLGESVQKLFYLPEAHTDFVFAVLAEELGFMGILLIMVLFMVLVGRALWWGYQAGLQKKWFASYMAYGLAIYFGVQAFISMGVNTGLLPTKGLALPFLSYGGSSLIMNLVAVGLLFRVAYESRLTQGKRVRG